MDVSSPQDLLQRTLAQVSRAVPRRRPTPFSVTYYIDADGETLKLAATNQEIGITSMDSAHRSMSQDGDGRCQVTLGVRQYLALGAGSILMDPAG